MHFILAADTFEIQYDVALWLVGGLLGICTTLIGVIWVLFNRLIDSKTKELTKSIEIERSDREKERAQLQQNIDQESDTREQGYKTLDDRSRTETKGCDDKFYNLNEKINDETKHRSEKQDALRTLVFADIDKWKERIGDIDVTVASFGGTYITRKEVDDRLDKIDDKIDKRN
jgi:hypothetical protein